MNRLFQTNKGHYKALIALGVPIMIGQVGQIVLALADTLMIGRYSTNGLGTASFVNNMFNLVIIFSTGFSYGLTPIVGALFGTKAYTSIGRMLKNSLLANTVITLILIGIMTVLYFNVERVGQPEELIPLIKPYYLILLASLPFVLWFNAFKQFADGITDTKISMWILLAGNLLNIIGNYILIYGKCGFPEMGLIGAGISTLVSRVGMLIAFVFIFFSVKRYHAYAEGFIQRPFNRKDFKQLNDMGWPVGLQMGMETAAFSLSTIMIGWLGTIALAGHQVMMSVSQVGFMVYYGMGAAVAVRVSNYKGQGDMANIRRTAAAGFHLIMAMALLISVVLFLLRNHIGGWFADDDDVRLLVAGLIIPFILYQFGDGLQITYANALRGISDVKPMMGIAFVAYFVISLPLGYLFAFIIGWGAFGVWMAFPFGLTIAGILFYLRFRNSIPA